MSASVPPRMLASSPRSILRSAAKVSVTVVLLGVLTLLFIPRHIPPCECGTDPNAAKMCRPINVFGHSYCLNCAAHRLFSFKKYPSALKGKEGLNGRK